MADTSSMRAAVAAAIEHEKKTATLGRLVLNALAEQRPDLDEAARQSRADAVVGAIRLYVETTPDMVERAIAAAETAGVRAQMTPIFETALAYVGEELDFIPDKLGLAGLVDDAYLVHGLMQEISHRHRALTGKDLVPVGVFEQSQRIRRLIGEPTATRLDVAVVAFARRANVREAVEQITAKIGAGGVSMDLPVTVAFSNSEELDDLPDLELGSLG